MYLFGPLSATPFWSIIAQDMKQTDPQYKLRLPQELKDQIETAAKAFGRSMNAEIVARLESSLQGYIDKDLNFKLLNAEVERLTEELRALRSESSPLMARIGEIVEGQVRHVMQLRGISFEDALLLLTTRGMALDEAAPAAVIQVAKGTTIQEARALMSTFNEYVPPDAHVFYEPSDHIKETKVLTTKDDTAALVRRAKASKAN